MKNRLTLDIPEYSLSAKEEIPDKKTNIEVIKNPKHKERIKPTPKPSERVDHKEEMIKRKMLNLARAIAKRTKIEMPKEENIKKEVKDKKNYYSIELDITQKQIDSLPIGLKKLLK